MPSISLTGESRRRHRDVERRFDQRNIAIIRSADVNYCHSMEGETLPSYCELPAPPVYVKIENSSNNNNNEITALSQEEHTSRSIPSIIYNDGTTSSHYFPEIDGTVVVSIAAINRQPNVVIAQSSTLVNNTTSNDDFITITDASLLPPNSSASLPPSQ